MVHHQKSKFLVSIDGKVMMMMVQNLVHMNNIKLIQEWILYLVDMQHMDHHQMKIVLLDKLNNSYLRGELDLCKQLVNQVHIEDILWLLLHYRCLMDSLYIYHYHLKMYQLDKLYIHY